MGQRSHEIITRTLADLYLNQGIKTKARKIYEKLLEQNPNDERLKKKIKLTYSSENTSCTFLGKEGNKENRLYLEDMNPKLEKRAEYTTKHHLVDKLSSNYSKRNRKSAEKTIKILKKWLETLKD